MASLVCRSTSLTNISVLRVTVLDIAEVKKGRKRYSEWVYVIGVTWSDSREHKIYRSYNEVSTFYNSVVKLISATKLKSRVIKTLPKVPGRGFFDWSAIKLMVRHQAIVDSFLRTLISLPSQISRNKDVLDFYELRDADNQNNVVNSRCMVIANDNARPQCSEPETVDNGSNDANSISNDSKVDGSHVLYAASQRALTPPNSLPVSSCFEPDDDYLAAGYQTLLDDISSLDLFEDYSTTNDLFHGGHAYVRYALFDDERWLRECEEIISPYSPNKAYFRLVHAIDERNECAS